MSSQARISQFRMTFPVTEYIPSFHLPVDFPHKMQIAQTLQGWFEDVDYLILIELCNENIQGLFFLWLRHSKISYAEKLLMELKKKRKEAICCSSICFHLWSNRCCHWWDNWILGVAKHVWKEAVISELISSTNACFLLSIQRLSLENAMVAVCSFSVKVSDITLLNVSEQMMNVFLF